MRLEARTGTSRAALVMAPVGAIVVTLLICALLVACAGAPVGKAYLLLLEGGFGSRFAWSETLTRATPLIQTSPQGRMSRRTVTGTGLGLGASSTAAGAGVDSCAAGGGAGVLVTSAVAAGFAVDGVAAELAANSGPGIAPLPGGDAGSAGFCATAGGGAGAAACGKGYTAGGFGCTTSDRVMRALGVPRPH